MSLKVTLTQISRHLQDYGSAYSASRELLKLESDWQTQQVLRKNAE